MMDLSIWEWFGLGMIGLCWAAAIYAKINLIQLERRYVAHHRFLIITTDEEKNIIKARYNEYYIYPNPEDDQGFVINVHEN